MLSEQQLKKRIYNTAYREANREALAAYDRARHPLRHDKSRYAKRPEYYKAISQRDRDAVKSDPLRKKDYTRRQFACYLKSRWGLSVEEYAWMLHGQGFRCAVPDCGETLLVDKFTHVDHSHTTLKIRSLLCHRCNVTLGKVKENQAILRGLAAYLELHR